MNNFNNKNRFSDDLLKPNKKNTYYYDFGTGKKVEKEEVKKTRDDFETDGQVLFGAFGTSPFEIGRYFKKKGYSVKTYEGDKEILNAEIPDADTYIMSFWNGDTVSSMIHTVSFDKLDNGKYRVYNVGKNGIEETNSINFYLRRKRYVPLVLHCIKKG